MRVTLLARCAPTVWGLNRGRCASSAEETCVQHGAGGSAPALLLYEEVRLQVDVEGEGAQEELLQLTRAQPQVACSIRADKLGEQLQRLEDERGELMRRIDLVGARARARVGVGVSRAPPG